MIILTPTEQNAVEAVIGPFRGIKLIYPRWKRWAGWGGMTQPGIVQGRDGLCKIVMLTPEARGDATKVAQFLQRVSLYDSLASCRGLPRSIFHNDHYLVTEWWPGDLLSKTPIVAADVESLAGAVGEVYARMEVVSNPWGGAEILATSEEMHSQGLLPTGIVAQIDRRLGQFKIPRQLRKGACFGDTALKNFVRRGTGEVGYIDTMGVDLVEMPINIEKLYTVLGPRWGEVFLDHMSEYEALLGDPRADRTYFKLVLFLRHIKAKSTGGRGLVAFLRRRRAKAALHQLQILLQCES